MGKPLKVLIVEDSPDDVDLVLRELKKGGIDPTFERVETRDAMAAALARETWDLVISDYAMPHFDGLQALRLVQEKRPNLPFILVSGTVGEETAVEAMKAGAHDYLLKGKLARLVQVVERALQETALRAERGNLEEQLRQSQKMESIGRLVGGIAHDFNNLLAVIAGYSELLLKKVSPRDPLFEGLKEINEAGDRSIALVRQLLAFSRRQILETRTLDLNQVVKGMGKMLERIIGENISLKTSFDPSLGTVKADPGQIEQVIMNLALNGRDAMPRGGKLTLETKNVELGASYCRDHPEVTPGRHVLLAVTDTGSGMDKATMEKIFEPFFTTKETGKGTGLGLSTVYGIVKQSGGSVFVYSEVGQGTSFKVYLPRLARLDTQPEAVAPVKRAEARPSSPKRTILLVEDEEKLSRMIARILEERGHTVFLAANGQDADRLAGNKGKIDLLITDLVLPGESGSSLAGRLIAGDPSLRVLYISGYADDAVVHHGLVADRATFLQKPFTPEALIEKIEKIS